MIAIIPARGGSKRLPRKNILPLGGQPMIGYPIKAALDSDLFSEVVVSTEDAEIADIAGGFGAKVVARNAELASDTCGVDEVCLDFLKHIDINVCPAFCCIYATAALIEPSDLVAGYELLQTTAADTVMSVSHYNYHPVQALQTSDGFLKPMWPEFSHLKSQSYPDLVVSNGTFYWSETEAYLQNRSFYGRRLKPFLLPPEKAVDIDTPEDYERAQLMFSHRSQSTRSA